MAAYNKFDCFTLDHNIKVHNLNSDTLKILLTNVQPVRTNKVKGDLTEITAGNGYAPGGSVAAFVSGNNVAGVYKLILSPVVFTAAGGNFAPFQWASLYNATASGLNLISWWDYGTQITLTNGNSFTVSLDQTDGVFSDV